MNLHVLLRGFSFLVGHERSHFTLPASADVDGATMSPVAEFGNVVMLATVAALALAFTAWAFAMTAGCSVMRLAAVA